MNKARFYVLTLAIMLLDQVSKFFVNRFVSPPPSSVNLWGDFIKVVKVTNPGAAFGIFSKGNLYLIFIGILVVVFIVLLSKGSLSRGLFLGLSVQLGGALGNLIDRIRLGYVVDFISIDAYPCFNLADLAITVGIVLMVYELLIRQRKVS